MALTTKQAFAEATGSRELTHHTHEAIPGIETKHVVHFEYADGTRRTFDGKSWHVTLAPARG